MLHEDYARPAPQEPWGYDNKLYEWQNSYETLKVQKSKIKEELIRVAWHPSRWWDWCVLEDEKKDTEISLETYNKDVEIWSNKGYN